MVLQAKRSKNTVDSVDFIVLRQFCTFPTISCDTIVWRIIHQEQSGMSLSSVTDVCLPTLLDKISDKMES